MSDLAQNLISFKKRICHIASKALLAGLAVILSVVVTSAQNPDKQTSPVTPQATQPQAPPRVAVQQTASISPQFEIATVKPNRSTDPNNDKGYWRAVKGDEVKITMRNGNLLTFIEEAYGLKEYQIKGPEWLKSERFDIVATASHVTRSQLALMLQTLLKERFKLEVHRESRVLPVYALVQGKNGAKIQPVKAEGDAGVWNGIGKLTAKKLSMPNFAESLSGQMDRPVVDMTGLEGVFDFTLEYTNQNIQPLPGGDGDGGAVAPDFGSGPSIFTALQEQLGLKLESRKAPVQILVVDHAEKVPTEN